MRRDGADPLPRDARAPAAPAAGSSRASERPRRRRSSRGRARRPGAPPPKGFAGVRLTDVAQQVGLDFRQGAFRYGVTADPPAMMGGGALLARLRQRRLDGPLRRQLLRRGRHRRAGTARRPAAQRALPERPRAASRRSGAAPPTRVGEGCVAADLNGDGHTDLYVTSAADDQLLWNNGDGTFTEGARAPPGSSPSAGTPAPRSADVNGDGRPDLFVAGYTERERRRSRARRPASRRTTSASATSSSSTLGATGTLPGGRRGRSGIDPKPYDHSLGAVFTDLNSDGRPRPLRRERRGPEPRVPERAAAARSGSTSSSRAQSSASPTGTPAWASPPATTTATAAPTCSSRTHAARSTRSSGDARGCGFVDAAPVVRRRVRARTSPAGATPGST